MFLHLISEKDLRLRVKDGWAEVFFKSHPDLVLGKRHIECVEDILHFDEAWEKITGVIGPFLPADLIEDHIRELFDGIAYLSYGFSCCNCPSCSKELTRDKVILNTQVNLTFFYCPYCRDKIKLKIWDRLPKKSLKNITKITSK